MKKFQALMGMLLMFSLSACGNLSAPADVSDTAALAQKPAKPPTPPKPPVPPTTPSTSNDVRVQCSFDGTISTCEIAINGKKQVRTYEGQVSIRTSTVAGTAVVQILRNGVVIDEIRG